MKLSAKITDQGQVESLIRVVTMVSKLSKQCVIRFLPDRIGFVRTGPTRSDGNKFYCEITPTCYFEDFRMEGWSAEENEIYLEIMPDELLMALRSGATASMIKIKLTKKTNVPYLTVDVQLSSSAARSVMHDVPITICPPRLWSEFVEPDLPDWSVSVYLPNVKLMHKIVSGMKTMSNYMVISAPSKGGDMKLEIRTDGAELTTYFKDLTYAVWGNPTDNNSQAGSQQSQLSSRQVSERPGTTMANDSEITAEQQHQRPADGDNEEGGEKLYSARVDIKTLAQFLASQQSTHYRLIMSILDKRTLHFCALGEELKFQYFIPAIDE